MIYNVCLKCEREFFSAKKKKLCVDCSKLLSEWIVLLGKHHLYLMYAESIPEELRK